MNATPPVTYMAEGDGVGWIVFDDASSRANVFNDEMQDAFAAALTLAEQDASLKAVVVMSGKERVFIAGADLKIIAAFPDAPTATEFSRRGQRLLQSLADFRVPVVCAIHGACAGGGFELALACHWRIATDADVTVIGLPETSLGTIPGWGGSVRLPRLIGVKAALEHILKARLVSAAEARAAGLVNEVVPTADLRMRARFTALALSAAGRPRIPLSVTLMPGYFAELRQSVGAKMRGQNSALLAAIDVVEQTVQEPIAEALEIEARIFGEVTARPACRNLIRVFFLQEEAKKRTLAGWFDDPREVASRERVEVTNKLGQGPFQSRIRTVGIVGAGVMGSGIAQWVAAHGFDVVLREVEPEMLERGLGVARRLFDEAVKRGKFTAGEVNAALQRIAVTTGWDGFEKCDLVIEAIVESARAKQALFTEVAGVVSPATILASNTSALPIEEIASHVPNPARTVGIHFFNPVSRMALVELIIGRQTSRESAESVLAFVKSLGKTPVLCRSSPGFLVTRVLFFYLNEAVWLRERGAQTPHIDDAMSEFGWPMGPLRLIDEVGVDVTDFIFRELEHYFGRRFTRSTTCEEMVRKGLLGRKNGASSGFYRYDGGTEKVNDEAPGPGRPQPAVGDAGAASGRMDIVNILMRVMVEEATRCVDEGVVRSADDVDFALVSGAGFPAFRGGLLHWSRDLEWPKFDYKSQSPE